MTMPVARASNDEARSPPPVVRAYHDRTKHRWKAYAAGPETLDWESQPAPFRRFAGAPTVALPRGFDDCVAVSLERPFSTIFHRCTPTPPSLASLGALLHLALGITAWKSFGPDRWAVRANPSSGNLHPVEAYVIVRALPGVPAGVYHYRPEDHALERRASLVDADETAPAVAVGLSTVMWRETWKYGERAFRYCQLDTGHAIAALHYAARALGWRLSEQPQVVTASLAQALGLDRPLDFPSTRGGDTEGEEAEALLALSFSASPPIPIDARSLRRAVASAEWTGVASTIDPHPMYRWPIVRDIAESTRVDHVAAESRSAAGLGGDEDVVASSEGPRSIAEVILGRRSAQRFDARHWLDPNEFFGLLDSVRSHRLSNVLARSHAIGFLLFVHRVTGFDPGLYFLAGPERRSSTLAERLASHFEMLPIAAAPPRLDLRRIACVDARSLARLARSLHCHQDIAAQACFALGMVADFDAVDRHPAEYRSLHREAGMLGHALYLEAEAHGLRGTGIGCFFDDEVHDLLKLTDARFQTLYHFAVGKPVDDPRIETTPSVLPPIQCETAGREVP